MILNKVRISSYGLYNKRVDIFSKFCLFTTLRPHQNSTDFIVEGKKIRFENDGNFFKGIKYDKNTQRNLEIKSGQHDKLLFDDPDCFGTLSGFDASIPEEPLEEDDLKEEKFLSEVPNYYGQLSTKQYADMIKDHLNNHRLKEAIDVLEIRMIKEDGVKVMKYFYNLLISGCARVGYTKKAFMLFNDMKRRGKTPTGGTYASLFNACANSPWPASDGRDRAIRLRELMIEKGVVPNTSIYNAMIKAFGRAGDLETSFKIIDEMLNQKIKIRNHTFGFLLQACISDKVSGFRHAMIIWKKMLQRREKPTIYNFNLLLKCTKECGLGNEVQVEEMLKLLYSNTNHVVVSDATHMIQNIKELETNSNDSHKTINSPEDVALQIFKINSNVFEASDSKIVCVKSFSKLSKPHEKFLLFGGFDGFMDEMNKYSVEPDIKTFTLLLDVIPNTLEAETKLLNKLWENPKSLADVDFYNMLMKKRCYRFDYYGAKNVREFFLFENKKRKRKIRRRKSCKLEADIVTYGILALTCVNVNDAINLLKEMDDQKKRSNIEIMGTFLRAAICKDDVEYVLFVMDRVQVDDITPNKLFLTRLQNYSEHCQRILSNKKSRDGQLQKRCEFEKSYENWIKKINVDELPENRHPWQQFREKQNATFGSPAAEDFRAPFIKRRKPFRPYLP